MTTADLELVESPVTMSSRDRRVYTLDTTDYGGSPTSYTMTAINMSSGVDVSAQVLTGSASVSGDVITWQTIENLIAGQQYAFDFEFVCGGQRYERRLVAYVVM